MFLCEIIIIIIIIIVIIITIINLIRQKLGLGKVPH